MFRNIENKEYNLNSESNLNESLRQGEVFKKTIEQEGFAVLKEGFDPDYGDYKNPAEDASFFDVFDSQRESAGNPHNLDKKFTKLNTNYERYFEQGNAGPPEVETALNNYKHSAEMYALQSAGLKQKLKACKKDCAEQHATNQGSLKDCNRGCALSYPKWGNQPRDLFKNSANGEITCASVSGADGLCDAQNFKVKSSQLTASERSTLGSLDVKGIYTPLSGCTACGGGIIGSMIVRDDNGNIIKKGTSVANNLKAKSNWNALTTNYNSITNDALNKDTDLFNASFFNPNDSNNNKSQTLMDRYQDMKMKSELLENAQKSGTKWVFKADDFIKKTSEEIDKDGKTDIPQLFKDYKNALKSHLNENTNLDTYKGRLEDSLLKQRSQLYKNGAFSVLAISLAIYAMYKIKQIN